jgi:ATP-binding cassette, subfamily F, member 3
MLRVSQVSKKFGLNTVLENVTFTISPGERSGLIGPNGCGKTTLLRILVGEEHADTGSVHIDPPGLRIGYLPQGLAPADEDTVGSYLGRMHGDMEALSKELEALAVALARTPHQLGLQEAYDSALDSLTRMAEDQGNLPVALASLGLSEYPMKTPVKILSGGQKTRLALAGVLTAEPQLLILDEPTNHLDVGMLEWLENWLNDYPGAALIVSHDRTFLDRTVTSVLELDLQSHSMRSFAGNYSDYLEQKLLEHEKLWQAYSDQLEEIARLRQAAVRVRGDAAFKKGGKGDSGDKFAKGFFANRTRRTVKRAKSLEKRLDHLMTEEKIEKPKAGWQMKMEFNDTQESGRDILRCEALSVGYGDLILVRDFTHVLRFNSRVALIGPNGAGKTTLLRTIIGSIPPLAGRLNLGASIKLGYMAQEQENLDHTSDALTLIRQSAPLSETDARTFLHKFLFSGDDVFVPIHKLSYGERARLTLACLIAQGCNFLLLDEPINHLDIPSRSRFEQALANFEGTILAVVHDRYFIEGYASEIWEVKDQSIEIYQPL